MTPYKSSRIFSQAGFTLVEMMIALIIAALGMTAILVANMGQTQSYVTQLAIANARQKARAAIAILRSDILMANQFQAADATSMTLRMPNNAPNVQYQWVNNQLRRTENGVAPGPDDVFADGIDGIEFLYNFKNAPSITNPALAQLGNIASVTISLVSQADSADPHFQDRDTYRAASRQAWEPAASNLNNNPSPNDNFHRRFWQETVACRMVQ